MGKAAIQLSGATRPLSGTPGAIWMHCLCWKQYTQWDSIQEKLLWTKQAHLWETWVYCQQVLAQFHSSCYDQALALGEVWAMRLALQ